MSRTGFIDHIGIGVPDLAAAKRYYDDLMPILGLRQWFPTSPEGSFNYGPDGAMGPQLFFYQSLEPRTYSRHGTGLQHICFLVASRAIVREAYEWARAQSAEIVHEPRDSQSTASITRPTGSILTDSCSKRFATNLKRAK